MTLNNMLQVSFWIKTWPLPLVKAFKFKNSLFIPEFSYCGHCCYLCLFSDSLSKVIAVDRKENAYIVGFTNSNDENE